MTRCNENYPPQIPRHLAVLVLLLLAVALLCLRFPTFDEPFERDLTTYALIGEGMREGRALYADLWDHKPPGIHLVYAAASALAPSRQSAVNGLNIAGNLVVLLGLYTLLARHARSRPAGLLAAGFWVLCSGDLRLQGNQPNVELFLNAALIWAWHFMLCLNSDVPMRGKARPLLLTGLAFFLATLLKPLAVFPALALSAHHFITAKDRRSALRDILSLALIGALLWGLTCLVFLGLGTFTDFYSAVIVFNSAYAGDGVLQNLLRGLRPELFFNRALYGLAPALGLSLCACFVAFLPRMPDSPLRRTARSLLAILPAMFLAVASSGKFFAHYYQLYLLPACVGAALAPLLLARLPLPRTPRLGLAWGSLGLTLLALLLLQLPLLTMNGKAASQYKYKSWMQGTQILADTVTDLLEPGERFFLWGNKTGVYFYSGQTPPTGLFFLSPLKIPAMAEALSDTLYTELVAARPDLIIMNDQLPPPQGHPARKVYSWIRTHYTRAGAIAMYSFHYRTGSELARRNPPVAARRHAADGISAKGHAG